MHVYKDLIRCKSVCDVKSRVDQRPFWFCRVPNDAYFFVSFEAYKNLTFGQKRTKNGAALFKQVQRFYFSERNILGLGALKIFKIL